MGTLDADVRAKSTQGATAAVQTRSHLPSTATSITAIQCKHQHAYTKIKNIDYNIVVNQ
jgi:hypothetical protein